MAFSSAGSDWCSGRGRRLSGGKVDDHHPVQAPACTEIGQVSYQRGRVAGRGQAGPDLRVGRGQLLPDRRRRPGRQHPAGRKLLGPFGQRSSGDVMAGRIRDRPPRAARTPRRGEAPSRSRPRRRPRSWRPSRAPDEPYAYLHRASASPGRAAAAGQAGRGMPAHWPGTVQTIRAVAIPVVYAEMRHRKSRRYPAQAKGRRRSAVRLAVLRSGVVSRWIPPGRGTRIKVWMLRPIECLNRSHGERA